MIHSRTAERPLLSDDILGQPSLPGPGQISPDVEEEEELHVQEVLSWNRLPWWRRPSPYWPVFGIFFSSIGYAALIAPKVALYTDLACRVHRPETVTNSQRSFTPLLAREVVAVHATDVSIADVSDGDETVVSIFLPTPAYSILFDSTENDDSQQKCASDPVVQAVVAKLNAVFVTAMGVLTCLSSGWWGSFSDRYGRRIAVFASILGLFINDVIHIITAWFVDVLPGGYWFPLIGFLIEGLCGSLSSRMAVTHAYLADTTEPSTRSQYFALQLGFMFAGTAIGPALGGLFLRLTGSILSPFYVATVLHGIYTTFALCVPESLTSARARVARLRRKQEKANQIPSGHVVGLFKSFTRFLGPLAMLIPRSSSGASPKRSKSDWNLFFIAAAYALVMTTFGAVNYKLQYATAQFNWTPEDASYYISIVGAARAVFLAIMLPLVIKYFKPYPIQLRSTSNDPVESVAGLSTSWETGLPPGPGETNRFHPSPHSSTFDLASARISTGLQTLAFLGMAVTSTGTLFTLMGVAESFTTGFYPAAQVLALDVYTVGHSQNLGETGKLFGALSVIQALGSQIISPALYGFVYFNTVASFPQAIMIVSMCTTMLALAFVLFVRIPSRPVSDTVASGRENEGHQDTDTPGISVAIRDEGSGRGR